MASFFSSPAWAEEQGELSETNVADEVEITEDARKLFRAGVDFMQDPDGARYAEAYRSFKAAYAESPSWKILGNLGISAMKIERDGEALEALETYLRQGRETFDKEEVEQVERDIRTLKTAVTWITISTNVPDAGIEDVRTPLSGEPRSNRYGDAQGELRIGIHNGKHRITVTKEGYEPAIWNFTASGGELSHRFELGKTPEAAPVAVVAAQEPEPEKVRPVRTVTWITIGTAGAATIGATVTGILALNKNNKYYDPSTPPGDLDGLQKSGKTLNVTTDVLIGVAVVSAGIAAVTYFTRPEIDATQDRARRDPPARSLGVTPVALRKGAGVFMQGTF
jgi:hypothetical protein